MNIGKRTGHESSISVSKGKTTATKRIGITNQRRLVR